MAKEGDSSFLLNIPVLLMDRCHVPENNTLGCSSLIYITLYNVQQYGSTPSPCFRPRSAPEKLGENTNGLRIRNGGIDRGWHKREQPRTGR
jgi:hypothetical protein